MAKFKCTGISDTHMFHEHAKLKGGDFLFHAGDISWFGQPEEVEKFIEWFGKQDYKHKVFIAGNHDFGFEPIGEGVPSDKDGNFYFRRYNLRKGLEDHYRDMAAKHGVHYLNKELIELDGVKIYGIPDQPEFCGWAFNYSKSSYAYATRIYNEIPYGLDVLITHGPPYGRLDKPSALTQAFGDYRLGCPVLREYVDSRKPKFHIFGHIHEGHGRVKTKDTTFINAAFCGIPYENFQKPINFLLDKS